MLNINNVNFLYIGIIIIVILLLVMMYQTSNNKKYEFEYGTSFVVDTPKGLIKISKNQLLVELRQIKQLLLKINVAKFSTNDQILSLLDETNRNLFNFTNIKNNIERIKNNKNANEILTAIIKLSNDIDPSMKHDEQIYNTICEFDEDKLTINLSTKDKFDVLLKQLEIATKYVEFGLTNQGKLDLTHLYKLLHECHIDIFKTGEKSRIDTGSSYDSCFVPKKYTEDFDPLSELKKMDVDKININKINNDKQKLNSGIFCDLGIFQHINFDDSQIQTSASNIIYLSEKNIKLPKSNYNIIDKSNRNNSNVRYAGGKSLPDEIMILDNYK